MAYVGGSLVSLFDKAPEATKVLLTKMAHKGGDLMVDIAVLNTPIKTGNLRTSWYQIPTHPVPDGYESGVATDVHYAPYVEWNTKPHVINAKPGGALKFMGKDGIVFAKKVNHPGTTGHHMVAIAADFVKGTLDWEPEVSIWAATIEAGAD